MKGMKQIINNLRKSVGKKNGVIKSQYLDHPEYELMDAKDKRKYSRRKLKEPSND